jgi:hypothetical protein
MLSHLDTFEMMFGSPAHCDCAITEIAEKDDWKKPAQRTKNGDVLKQLLSSVQNERLSEFHLACCH